MVKITLLWLWKRTCWVVDTNWAGNGWSSTALMSKCGNGNGNGWSEGEGWKEEEEVKKKKKKNRKNWKRAKEFFLFSHLFIYWLWFFFSSFNWNLFLMSWFHDRLNSGEVALSFFEILNSSAFGFSLTSCFFLSSLNPLEPSGPAGCLRMYTGCGALAGFCLLF